MAAPDVLGLRALGRATLARQMLLARQKTTLHDVTERLMGLQAQWPKPPFVGLWSRIRGFSRDALVRAAMERTVVRATMMRGTIHLVTRRDFLALRGTIQPVLSRGLRAVLRERLDALDVESVLQISREALTDRPRTFTELRAHLMARHPAGDERAMGFAVRMLLPLVMAPIESASGWPGDADFALAEPFLGEPIVDREAPDALMLRYLAAFGPATVSDAQSWSGLQGLAVVFARLRPQLQTFRDARKRELFDLPAAPRPRPDIDAPVRFLPDFDNLLLGHADRTRFVAEEHRPHIYGSKNGRVRSTYLVDGVAAGLWDVALERSRATIVLAPFGKLAKKTGMELEEEATALVRFVEPDATSFAVRFAKP